MSLFEETTIECPACGTEQTYRLWQSVNVTHAPDLKQKLLDRTLVTFTCKKCSHTAQVEQALLYHDMELNLMVSCGEEAPEELSLDGLGSNTRKIQATYTFRIVGSINELVDKVLIWDAGLDDRIVEVFKILLLQQIDKSQRGEHPELFFGEILHKPDTAVEMGFVLVNESGTTGLSVPFEETFQSFEAGFCNRLPSLESEQGEWLRVDREYALKCLNAE